MRHRIFFHVIWTTRDRADSIDAPVATFLVRYCRAVAKQERSAVLAIGLVTDHLHLVLRCHPTVSIPHLVKRLKGGSAVLANREGHARAKRLKWARGYDVESVSPRAVERVIDYVVSQPARHPDRAISDWCSPEPALDTVLQSEFEERYHRASSSSSRLTIAARRADSR